MIQTIETKSPKLVGFKLCGKLRDEDFKQFVPTMETILTSEGKVRLFVQLEDFHGCDLHAAWDEIKFALEHYSDFERIAVVGDQKWQEWIASFWKPFTKAKVNYFEHSEVDAAWAWLLANDEGDAATEEKTRTSVMPTEANRSYPWIWYGL